MKHVTLPTLLGFTLIALAACGGGSVSSGGAGSGGGSERTSSLVVQVGNDARTAAVRAGHSGRQSIAAVAAGLIMRNAMAQTADVPIYVDGAQVATTDAGGSAVIPLAAGTYELCILDPAVPQNCATVTVEPDSVVVVSDVNIDEEGIVTFGPVTTELATDNIAAFQDPDNAVKTIICHQTGAGQFTISVATPAVIDGHLGHGDTLGACPEDSGGIAAEPDGPAGPPQGAGPPEGAGRPENAGPPESAGRPEDAGPPDSA
jgi:hypothetical protein